MSAEVCSHISNAPRLRWLQFGGFAISPVVGCKAKAFVEQLKADGHSIIEGSFSVASYDPVRQLSTHISLLFSLFAVLVHLQSDQRPFVNTLCLLQPFRLTHRHNEIWVLKADDGATDN